MEFYLNEINIINYINFSISWITFRNKSIHWITYITSNKSKKISRIVMISLFFMNLFRIMENFHKSNDEKDNLYSNEMYNLSTKFEKLTIKEEPIERSNKKVFAQIIIIKLKSNWEPTKFF